MPSRPRPAPKAALHPVPRRALLRSGTVLAAGAAGVVAGCSVTDDDPHAGRGSADAPGPSPQVVARQEGVGVVPPTALADRSPAGLAALALTVSRAVVERATVVVVAPAADAPLGEGIAASRRLGLPLLLAGDGLGDELDRLGAQTVVRVAGGGGSTGAPQAPSRLPGRVVLTWGSRDVTELAGLPLTPQGTGCVALVPDGGMVPDVVGALLTAVGGTTLTVGEPDPRRADGARKALRDAPTAAVVGLGAGFGDAERFAHRVRTARHAAELPGGGLMPFPGRLMVALYGHPGTAALGMLGEQPPERAARRAVALAEEYGALTRTPVVPAFELIATVASGSKGSDGDYSSPTRVRDLLPWVEAAERAGAYVVLDLQPGRTDFVTQAKLYESLLRRPWVGLALDPEWRLGPKQKHLDQIGSVSVDEVNAVGAWLAALVREHDLPPKVLTLHQFRSSMVRDRERLDTSLDEVQWLVHADGQGTQGAKQDTWRALRRGLPRGVHLGWKNFEDEDAPMLTPRQTLEQVRPTPQFVSYQ